MGQDEGHTCRRECQGSVMLTMTPTSPLLCTTICSRSHLVIHRNNVNIHYAIWVISLIWQRITTFPKYEVHWLCQGFYKFSITGPKLKCFQSMTKVGSRTTWLVKKKPSICFFVCLFLPARWTVLAMNIAEYLGMVDTIWFLNIMFW